jgi:hypothetical protein
MWYPPVSDETATGAVVAVKKHRQQQIAPQDVILGDETARKQEQILYADFIADAESLESHSASLALALRNRSAQDLGVAHAELAALSKDLGVQTGQLENRSFLAAQNALAAMRAFLAAAPAELEMRRELEADLQNLDASLANRGASLASADIDGVRMQLEKFTQHLDAARALDLASADRMVSRLDQIRNDLESKAVDEAALAAMTTELNALTQQLGRSTALELASLGRYESYLGAMARESEALGVARESLDAVNRKLEAKNPLDSRDRLALEKASQLLAARGVELENRAVENLESRMEIMTLENKAVQSLDGSLGALSESLSNRSAQQLSSQARQQLELGIKAADQALANRRSGLETALLGAAQMELAALGAHLDNRAKLDNRWAEAGMTQNRGAQLDNVREYLGRMSQNFANRSASAENRSAQSLENQKRQTEIQNKAKELENRAKQLESSSAWSRI